MIRDAPHVFRPLIFLVLSFSFLKSQATELRNCADDATLDANIEDGVAIASGNCGVIDSNIGAIAGNIELSNNSQLTIYGDLSGVSGNITITGTSQLTIHGNVTLTGNLEVSNSSTLTVTGTVTLNGSTELDGSSVLMMNGGEIVLTSGNVEFKNNGMLDMRNGSTIRVLDPGSKVENTSAGTNLMSDGSGNNIITPLFEGPSGPFACSGGTCSDTPGVTKGVTITESAGRTITYESGVADEVEFVLDEIPSASNSVTINLSSSDVAEITVSPASITFTTGNWDTPQLVTITPVDDATKDGTAAVQLVTSNASSGDVDYSGMIIPDVIVLNRDDGVGGGSTYPSAAVAGFTLNKTTSSITEGNDDTFTVVLDDQPATNVVFSVSSDNAAATLDESSLTFTNGNWNTPQTVTITGVEDDNLIDESPVITISVLDVVSDDDFDGLPDQTVSVTITDNDIAGYTLNKTASSITEGNDDTFTVVLDAEPSSDVVVDIASDDAGAASVSDASLTFTIANWDTPQTITITAEQDDDLADETPTITVSVDPALSDDAFDALGDQTVSITLTDDDAAGYTLSKTASSVTEGTDDSFTIVLDAQPASDVSIEVGSDDAGAASVSPGSLIFTTSNWNSPQTVTITAEQDDDLLDENLTVTATIKDGMSDDDFDGLPDQTVDVTLSDDDDAGFTLSKTVSAITEGNDDTFTVVLDAQPSSDVFFVVSSDDEDAAAIDASPLIFSVGNWNTPQTVTITALQDDDLRGETPTITISVLDVVSDDDFDPLADQTVSVTVTDDDVAGYTLSKTASTLTEGNDDTFTVVLDAEPSSDVVIDVESDDAAAASVSPGSLTFTTGNWDTPQTVTITGEEDDDLLDETPTITMSVDPALSDDDFDALGDQTVTVTLSDDDVADFTLSKNALALNEGDDDSFTVVLDAAPSSNVVVDIGSDDPDAASVSIETLTFTPGNWNTPQVVTITAEEDDNLIDETPTVSVQVFDALSDDAFDGLPAQNVSVTITDNDIAGFTLSKTIATLDEGTNDVFTVVLDAEPASNVFLVVTSDDEDAASIDVSPLTFAVGNWDTPQTVTISAEQDDDLRDETPTITVAVLDVVSDDNFDALPDQTIAVTVTDDEEAGITLSKVATALSEGGNDTFTVVLDAEPSSDVVLDVSSDDTGAASVDLGTLTFTTANWNTPQTVTITAEQDDDLRDETPTVTVAVVPVSTDDDFDGVTSETVAVAITDDEVAGFALSKTTSTINEGDDDTFTVVLDAQPTSDVVIDVSSDDAGAASVDLGTLTFTAANWNTPQLVTITAEQDDDLRDESPTVTAAIVDGSSDDDFDGLAAALISVSVTDDDAAGYTLNKTTATLNEGDDEPFTVVLDAEPSSDVVFAISSDDNGAASVDLGNLTFTVANWDTPQTVTITAVQDDDLRDESPTITVSIVAASSDDDFDALANETVAVTITDIDVAGFAVSKTNASLSEGDTDTFTIVLEAEPSSDVVFDVSSDDAGAASVDVGTLTFTTADWDTPQTVTITAEQDDDLRDESLTLTAAIVPGSSDDDFDALADQAVAVSVTDDDVAGFTLSKTNSSILEGANDAFTVVLDAQPTSDVVVDLSSDDTGAASIDESILTFTAVNWNAAQTVTITAEEDDDLSDESPSLTLSVNSVLSDDDFDAVTDQVISVAITDNDVAGFTLSKANASITEGDDDPFTVVLDAQPSSDVVFTVSSNEPGAASVDPETLTFTMANWNTPQTVTITAEEDDDLSDETAAITLAVDAALSDDNFDGVADQNVSVTITDDDIASFILNKTTSTISEGSTDDFTVVLGAQPSTDVVFAVTSDDTGAATVDQGTLTFTTTDWDTPQTVTISAEVDDDLRDESPSITVAVVPGSSDDAFDAVADQILLVTITDTDMAGYSLSNNVSRLTEGDNETFTVVLDAQPTADVVLDLTSNDPGAATINPSVLTFTSSNWSAAQVVTITAQEDDDLLDEITTITVSVNDALSEDGFDGLADQVVSVEIADNDVAGVSVSTITGNTKEDGTSASFTMVLDAQPADDVTIGLSSSNSNEGTVSPASFTFSASNWNVAQTATVTGVDDEVLDGDVNYTIVTSNAASSDTKFDGLDVADVDVINEDDDAPPPNSVPVITGQLTVPEINEDNSFSIAIDNLNVTDENDAFPEDHTLIIEPGSDYTFTGIEVTPTENFNGQLEVNIKVNDGEDDSNVYGYLVEVNAVNDKPIANADEGTGNFGTQITGNLLINDTDVEGDELTITMVSPELDGFSFSPNGDYDYSGADRIGQLVFDYIVCDNGDPSECSQSMLTLTIVDGDLDGDGIPDSFELNFNDVDVDGIPEYLDEDSDNDGISDQMEAGPNPADPLDTDEDGLPNFVDLDSDADGKPDAEEGIEDCDQDGLANYLDAQDICDLPIKTSLAFSPNDDGRNDTWVIPGIEDYPNNKVMVFDRWGSKVFEMMGYDNQSRVWTGEFNIGNSSGSQVPYSTYYFVIDLNNGFKPQAGSILISR